MKNVKSICLKVSMVGNGVVQYDSKDQKHAHNRCTNVPLYANNNNNAFAKACFRKSSNPKDTKDLEKTIKISADGLRHAIHIEEHPFQNPNVGLSTFSRIAFLSNPGTLLRGYLVADANISIRKKSCYAVTSAHEVSDAVPTMEFFSRSGARAANSEKAQDDGSDTSIHSRETAGATRYQFELLIDPAELGFIPMDDLQDRRAVLDADKELFRASLASNLGLASVPDASYYVKAGSAYQIPERGIMLPSDVVKSLVASLIRKVAGIHISKSQSGYAQVDSIECIAINAPVDDPNGESVTLMPSGGRLDLTLFENLVQSFATVYKEQSLEEALSVRTEIDKQVTDAQAASKAKKKAKKDDKEKAKAKHKKAGEDPSSSEEEDSTEEEG